MLAAMRAHTRSEELLVFGCLTLIHLVRKGGAAADVVEQGGLETAMAAMAGFPGNARIHGNACVFINAAAETYFCPAATLRRRASLRA